MTAGVLDKWGQIDGLVANAALANSVGGAAYDEIEIDEWDRIMQVNVRGTWLTCRAIAPHMQRRKTGSIITVSSDTTMWGSPRLLHYVTSKGAVEAFTRAMARELGPDGVRINCIAPGLVRTDFARALWENPQTLKAVTAMTPLGRIGEPDEIAGAAVYLASKAGSFTTGQTIVVDGGATIAG